MSFIIINPIPPIWYQMGEKRPPEWMRKYFPKAWEKELFQYGSPGEVGKYFAEETMKRIREDLKI